MNLGEYRQLQAELGSLEQMIASTPDDFVIERLGLESRKAEIEHLLAAHPDLIRDPLRLRLTFRGKPIVGSYGMFAEFGATAVGTFTDAVAAIGASMSRSLGKRGSLPQREEFRLLITGTTTGSFGFEFEEPAAEDQASMLPSALDTAVEQTQAIMVASTGTDDELSEALTEVDPRALDALRKFLEELSKHEAVCALEFKEEVFRFADVEQLRRSSERLRQDNIHEADETLFGHFLGVLPKRRTFEFEVADAQTVIAGRVGEEFEDAAQLNQVIQRPVSIQVRSRYVGEGRPRYTLLGYRADTHRELGDMDV